MKDRERIEQVLNTTIRAMHPLSGGMIGEVYRVDFSDGQSVVAKVTQGTDATLDIEGRMLRYLAEHSVLPVPEVLHADANLLIMRYIKHAGSISPTVETDAAQHIAALHSISAPRYGLEFDTLIGSLHQPNTPDDSWIDFFREQRLFYMARIAYEAGQLPLRTRQRIEQFAMMLEDYLFEPDAPSLIHGDLWGGNVLSHQDKIAGFVDPAIYYAHDEIELAFSTLFSTFGTTFFDVYQQYRPIEANFFNERRNLYNLYPLLVHVHLFGGGYIGQVERILQQFGY
ncbi:MAG: fructosamine kinase family protein [Anaerolineae bacterium]